MKYLKSLINPDRKITSLHKGSTNNEIVTNTGAINTNNQDNTHTQHKNDNDKFAINSIFVLK